MYGEGKVGRAKEERRNKRYGISQGWVTKGQWKNKQLKFWFSMKVLRKS